MTRRSRGRKGGFCYEAAHRDPQRGARIISWTMTTVLGMPLAWIVGIWIGSR